MSSEACNPGATLCSRLDGPVCGFTYGNFSFPFLAQLAQIVIRYKTGVTSVESMSVSHVVIEEVFVRLRSIRFSATLFSHFAAEDVHKNPWV